MRFQDTSVTRWSPAGKIMAWVMATEVMVALVVIGNAEFHHTRVLVAAAAVMIASAVIAARSRMPVEVKAGSIATVCAALLALAAAQDPFGLRAIDRSFEDATRETYVPVISVEAATAPSDTARTSSNVALRGKGDPAAAAFADELASNVANRIGGDTGPYRIDGEIDVTSGAGGAVYRLTWTLGGPYEKRWCGRIVATGQARGAVLDSFGRTIAAALRQSRTGPLSCG